LRRVLSGRFDRNIGRNPVEVSKLTRHGLFQAPLGAAWAIEFSTLSMNDIGGRKLNFGGVS